MDEVDDPLDFSHNLTIRLIASPLILWTPWRNHSPAPQTVKMQVLGAPLHARASRVGLAIKIDDGL